MRYLTSISLALIVHVLLSIGILMALACTATPAPTPTPSGPMYSEEEAIAVLKEHLQNKPVPIPGHPLMCFQFVNGNSVNWSAKYDNEGHRWDISAKTSIWSQIIKGNEGKTQAPPINETWSVYERTKSIVANGLC